MNGYTQGFKYRMEWYNRGFKNWRRERENFARACVYLTKTFGPSAELGMARKEILDLDADPIWAFESEKRHVIYLKDAALTTMKISKEKWDRDPTQL